MEVRAPLVELRTNFNEMFKYRDKYRRKAIVIKFGGALAEDDDVIRSIGKQAAFLSHAIDADVVVVHGGGKQIDEALKKEGIEPKKDSMTGLRITDAKTLAVTDQALRTLNGRIVRIFQEASRDVLAFGMAGYDGRLIQAESTNEFTGRPVDMDAGYFEHILNYQNKDVVPIIYPVCWNDNTLYNSQLDFGENRLNVNADHVAAIIASKLEARRLILCSDIPGVKDKDGNVLTNLSTEDVDQLIENGTVTGGMITKLQAAAEAARQLPSGGVVILDGRVDNAILAELLNEQGVGTLIRTPERIRESQGLDAHIS